jgi:hypothetical protein
VNHSTEGSDPHTQAALDLPWLVNGTLSGDAAAQLRAHLSGCETCRGDYEAQLRLYGAMRAEDSLAFAAEPSFQKLMARIDGLEAAAGTTDFNLTLNAPAMALRTEVRAAEHRRPARLIRPSKLTYWLAAAVVIEAVGLALGPRLLRSPAPIGAPYTTLSTGSQPYGVRERVRVVFKPGVPLAELGELLRAIDAHIVDGPTDANVYTLGFAQAPLARARLEARIARLRASPEVIFAEPVNVTGPDR